MIKPGEIISYLEMCSEEKTSLQRGMNFRIGNGYSVILMSQRPNKKNGPDPKSVDQETHFSGGSLTQNGLFVEAVQRKHEGENPEKIKVYEKLRPGIWTFNGFFSLVDGWQEVEHGRKVFKFRLELSSQFENDMQLSETQLDHPRIIPTHVKLEVWKRDKGRCVQCGSKENLHFDHIIPYSKGGSSLVAENIQLLCARHNLEKRDKIQ